MFELVGTSWTQVVADIQGQSSGDRSGTSVAISDDGNTIAVGSPFDDDNGTNTGDVRAFRLSQPNAASCNGLTVTVNIGAGQLPTVGDDVILGTSGADVINALGGDDTICALGGNDTINGGGGIDTVFGDDGDDRLNGNAGNDVLNGGDGEDTLRGQNGNDTLNGENDDDDLIGGVGIDELNERKYLEPTRTRHQWREFRR